MNDDELLRSRRILMRSVALGMVGGLAGCVGFGDSGQNNPEPAEQTTSSATTEPTASPAPTTTPNSPSPTEPWTPPEPPRQPTEDKREDRINDAEFINTVKAQDGNGYTDFDLRIGANTWMKNVDPPKDEDGEPYFIVEINGQIVARTDIVPFRKEGSFTVPLKAAALDQFNSGALEVRVSLFDEDYTYADLYDTWTGTIEYSATGTA